MNGLVEQVRGGDRRAIARLITKVENDAAAARQAVGALYRFTGQAHIVGVTGPPGSGKSTLVNEMTKGLRQANLSVGIVAVDPSSPFTGGALLGDRVRMRDLAGDAGVFIRSMASRGSLGGLATTTADVVKVLDAAGFEVILVETVGAGQAEVDIAATAHTTLVVEAPGMGDDIQTIKAGILEIADILVVNKADRPGSDKTVKALQLMLHMGATRGRVSHHGRVMEIQGPDGFEGNEEFEWEVPVLETVAVHGKGIDALVEAMMAHRAFLSSSGEWMAREMARSRQEIGRLLQMTFMAQLREVVPPERRESVVAAVAERRLDPYAAVEQLFSQVRGSGSAIE